MKAEARTRFDARSGGGSHPPCTRETKQCDYTTWGPGYERPDCCTEHLIELLTFMNELLSTHGIVHWLDYGTLLGAVRNGQLIPWDDDGDMAMLARDDERVRPLRAVIEKAGYRLEINDASNIRVCYSKANYNHIDLFLWSEQDGLLVCDEDPVWHWPGMHDRQAFPREFVDELTEVALHGRLFPAPAPVHDFLREHRYGPSYMTPQRPITTLSIRPIIEPADMTPPARELLARIAQRDEYLVKLVNSHSRLLRTGFWTPGHTRWLILSGLPLETGQHHIEAARTHVPPEDRSQAVDKLVQTLAWVEGAIDEYANPPRLIALRRVYRRFRRASAAVAGLLRASPEP